jgi:hypothetical protein
MQRSATRQRPGSGGKAAAALPACRRLPPFPAAGPARPRGPLRSTTLQVHGRNFTPGVIEPSFGIGRIIYCVFEHNFYNREVRRPGRQPAEGGQRGAVPAHAARRRALLSAVSWPPAADR